MAQQARRMNLINAVLALIVVLGAVVFLASSALQQFLMYHPDHRRIPPGKLGLTGVEEIELTTPDGNTLVAWTSPAETGQPTVLYFHGNAGGLANRGMRMKVLKDAGFGIFIMAYRSYAGSSGRPTERDNVADAKRAFDRMVAMGVSPEDIFVFGESLGSGVAVQVAAARKPGGVILDAPYTSMLDLAGLHYPYLPSRWLLRDRYETMRYIGRVKAPLLIVHGDQDQIIPAEMGRAVLAAASEAEPKEYIEVPGAAHLDHDDLSFDRIVAWIKQMRAGRGAAVDSGKAM